MNRYLYKNHKGNFSSFPPDGKGFMNLQPPTRRDYKGSNQGHLDDPQH